MFARSKYWNETYPKYAIRISRGEYSLDVIATPADEIRVLGCCIGMATRAYNACKSGDRAMGYVWHISADERRVESGFYRLTRRVLNIDAGHITAIYAGKGALSRLFYLMRNARGLVFYDVNDQPFGTPEHVKSKIWGGEQCKFILTRGSLDYDFLRVVAHTADATEDGEIIPDDGDYIDGE